MMSSPSFSFTIPAIRHQAKSFRNDREEHLRLIRALERDFPSKSPNELSEKVAAKLAEEGNPVTPRGVRNWLRETSTPHWRSVIGLLRIMSSDSVDHVLKRGPRK